MTTAAWQAGTLYPPGSLVRRTTNPPATAQAITNPGFETGTLSGWTTEGSTWTAVTTFYDGAYGARFEPPSPIAGEAVGRIIASSPAPCRPGQSITASCMVKQGAASAGSAGGRVQLVWYEADMVTVISVSDGSNVNNSDTSNWRKSTVTATAPANAAYVAIAARCFQREETKKVHVDAFLWDHTYSDNNVEGLVYRAVQANAGYSGATEPNWPLVVGVQVIDNEVTWEAVDSAYVTWEAVPILKSGATEPNWPEQVGAAVDDGTVRWVAVSRRVEDENCPNTAGVIIMASKVFAVDDDIIAFSATVNPLDWTTREDAGYLPFGLQPFGSMPAKVLGAYRGNLIAMNSIGFQMWQVDQDPSNMALLDSAPIGSTYPRAHQAVGNDMLFLSGVGVRNLSIAAASTNLQAGSVGEPIDTLIKAELDSGEHEPISGVYPSEGQAWFVFGPTAYVYTSSGSGKGTWSRYTFPEEITDVTLLNSTLYLRAGSGTVWELTSDETADDVYCQGEAPVLIAADEYALSVDLAWTYDYPEFEAETFRILRSINGSLFAEIGSVDGSTFVYTDTDVAAGNTYAYAIVARPAVTEAIDSPYSNELVVDIAAVAPPPVLSGVMVGDDAELDWTAAGSLTGSTITGYEVWRSDDGGAYARITTTAGNVLTYTDLNLTESVQYRYYIVAVSDEETVSPNSNIVSLSYGTSVYAPSAWCNPSAESILSCWTETLGDMWANTNSAVTGSYSWYGRTATVSKMHQDFTTASTGVSDATVDAGGVEVVVDWWGGTYDQYKENDQPKLNIEFFDASMVSLGTATSGAKDPITPLVPGNLHLWGQYQTTATLPAGTRTVRIQLEAIKLRGANNDARFDDVYPYLRLI